MRYNPFLPPRWFFANMSICVVVNKIIQLKSNDLKTLFRAFSVRMVHRFQFPDGVLHIAAELHVLAHRGHWGIAQGQK